MNIFKHTKKTEPVIEQEKKLEPPSELAVLTAKLLRERWEEVKEEEKEAEENYAKRLEYTVGSIKIVELLTYTIGSFCRFYRIDNAEIDDRSSIECINSALKFVKETKKNRDIASATDLIKQELERK